MKPTRRLNLNEVSGHPDWYFGLVLRHADKSVDFTLWHDDGSHTDRTSFDMHVEYDAEQLFAPYKQEAQRVLDALVGLCERPR